MSDSIADVPQSLTVDASESGWRLDVFLVHRFPEYSRALIRKTIMAGDVSVDAHGGKPSYRLVPGQCVRVTLPEIPRHVPRPENIPLEILFEDEYLVVINKPAGMVVHPARGNWTGTLVSALQHRFGGQLSGVGGPLRPGIVHRLDRDTSGVLLVAKDDQTHGELSRLFHDRNVEKEYLALTSGVPDRDRDVIDEPIGKHPKHREKMAIRRGEADGRPAVTFFEVVERFRGYALVRLAPKTGRTHQIRVHLSHIGCPVVCDRIYGGQSRLARGRLVGDDTDGEVLIARQALHARRLRFPHPHSGEVVEFEAPLPEDMQRAVQSLRDHRAVAE